MKESLCASAQVGVLSVAHDIASGMEYVHGMSVFHGDMSVGNILFHMDGEKLTAKVIS